MNLSTVYWLTVALLVAAGIGLALCVSLMQRKLPEHFAWVFGPAIGLGVCSFLYVLFRRPMFTIEIALLLLSVTFLYRRLRNNSVLPRHRLVSAPGLLLLAAFLLALPMLLERIDRTPHGSYDGWAIWNTHARLLFRAGAEWKSLTRYTFHGDYPELTPALAARFWRYAGHEVPTAGAFSGLILAVSGVGVLLTVLSQLRDKRLALVMSMILLCTPRYLDSATSQYADAPLSFYVLATLALICLHAQGKEKAHSILVLAGFTAGCAAWTKNEGLLFVAGVCSAMLLPVLFRQARISERLVPFATGLAVPLAIIFVFKWTVPAQNDLIGNQNYATVIQHMTDSGRYILIASYFLKTFWTFGIWAISPWIPLLIYVAARGIDRPILKDSGHRVCVLAFAFVLAGYFFVYVNTPLDLKDHLDSSFYRLTVHLWPSFLLLLGLCTRKEQTAGSSGSQTTG